MNDQPARPPVPRYAAIARALVAYQNCVKSGNEEWKERHMDRVRDLCNALPSGGGFDSGCRLVAEESTGERLIFEADFHHMNRDGFYDGWSYHRVIVTASLSFGIAMKITGRNRNEIKEYIADLFHPILTELVDEYRKESA